MAGRKQGRKCFQSCPYQGEAFAEGKAGASQTVKLNRRAPVGRSLSGPKPSSKEGLETKEKRASLSRRSLRMFDRRAEYTVTDIARIAGANPRSVQHWTASKLLIAKSETDRKG